MTITTTTTTTRTFADVMMSLVRYLCYVIIGEREEEKDQRCRRGQAGSVQMEARESPMKTKHLLKNESFC